MSKLSIVCDTINKKLEAQLSQKEIKETSDKMGLSVQELINFQEIKSLAQIKRILSLDDALFIYNALGDWNNLNLGTKICLTKLHAELLQAKIQGKL
jgi:hypothetical protein